MSFTAGQHAMLVRPSAIGQKRPFKLALLRTLRTITGTRMNLLRRALQADQEAMKEIRSRPATEIEVQPVTPADVALVLQQRLTGSVTDEQLRAWADLLLTHDSYANPGSTDDDSVDFYESMWDVLQQLQLPALHGAATDERITEHLVTLKRLSAAH